MKRKNCYRWNELVREDEYLGISSRVKTYKKEVRKKKRKSLILGTIIATTVSAITVGTALVATSSNVKKVTKEQILSSILNSKRNPFVAPDHTIKLSDDLFNRVYNPLKPPVVEIYEKLVGSYPQSNPHPEIFVGKHKIYILFNEYGPMSQAFDKDDHDFKKYSDKENNDIVQLSSLSISVNTQTGEVETIKKVDIDGVKVKKLELSNNNDQFVVKSSSGYSNDELNTVEKMELKPIDVLKDGNKQLVYWIGEKEFFSKEQTISELQTGNYIDHEVGPKSYHFENSDLRFRNISQAMMSSMSSNFQEPSHHTYKTTSTFKDGDSISSLAGGQLKDAYIYDSKAFSDYTSVEKYWYSNLSTDERMLTPATYNLRILPTEKTSPFTIIDHPVWNVSKHTNSFGTTSPSLQGVTYASPTEWKTEGKAGSNGMPDKVDINEFLKNNENPEAIINGKRYHYYPKDYSVIVEPPLYAKRGFYWYKKDWTKVAETGKAEPDAVPLIEKAFDIWTVKVSTDTSLIFKSVDGYVYRLFQDRTDKTSNNKGNWKIETFFCSIAGFNAKFNTDFREGEVISTREIMRIFRRVAVRGDSVTFHSYHHVPEFHNNEAIFDFKEEGAILKPAVIAPLAKGGWFESTPSHATDVPAFSSDTVIYRLPNESAFTTHVEDAARVGQVADTRIVHIPIIRNNQSIGEYWTPSKTYNHYVSPKSAHLQDEFDVPDIDDAFKISITRTSQYTEKTWRNFNDDDNVKTIKVPIDQAVINQDTNLSKYTNTVITNYYEYNGKAYKEYQSAYHTARKDVAKELLKYIVYDSPYDYYIFKEKKYMTKADVLNEAINQLVREAYEVIAFSLQELDSLYKG